MRQAAAVLPCPYTRVNKAAGTRVNKTADKRKHKTAEHKTQRKERGRRWEERRSKGAVLRESGGLWSACGRLASVRKPDRLSEFGFARIRTEVSPIRGQRDTDCGIRGSL